MSAETFLAGRVVLHRGDCLEVLERLEAGSVDAVVTDPPYHLTSIVKRFGRDGAAAAKSDGPSGVYARASAGFMGQTWDGGDVAFRAETWAKVRRVVKPGGHLVAFCGTRTYHRLACAVEDAGFTVRDCVAWIYGSGFPKSRNIGRDVDALEGVTGTLCALRSPAHAGSIERGAMRGDDGGEGWQRPWMADPDHVEAAARVYRPASAAGRRFDGWGTALKPAMELAVVARAPLAERSVAANVVAHGTGALNVAGCKVDAGGGFGRWPANVSHDGSGEAVAGFPNTAGGTIPGRRGAGGVGTCGHRGQELGSAVTLEAGSAARYFYSAKADADARLGFDHPTVKPVDLMRWLVRLVTPPGGVVLDPFAGTGTTGAAAHREGARAVLIEAETRFADMIAERLGLEAAGPSTRAAARGRRKATRADAEALPLFGGHE